MRKNKTVPEVGQQLTISGQILSVSGRIMFEKGDKVTVTHVEMSKGYWSRLCPDIWVAPELRYVKIEGQSGDWLPDAFEETKESI
jgi:hypothetical protein